MDRDNIYDSTATVNHQISYTASEKLRIVKYAEVHGNHAAKVTVRQAASLESNTWP